MASKLTARRGRGRTEVSRAKNRIEDEAAQRRAMEVEMATLFISRVNYEATYLPDAVLIFPVVGRLGRDSAVAAIREENAANKHWAEVDFADVRVLGASLSISRPPPERPKPTRRRNDVTFRRPIRS